MKTFEFPKTDTETFEVPISDIIQFPLTSGYFMDRILNKTFDGYFSEGEWGNCVYTSGESDIRDFREKIQKSIEEVNDYILRIIVGEYEDKDFKPLFLYWRVDDKILPKIQGFRKLRELSCNDVRMSSVKINHLPRLTSLGFYTSVVNILDISELDTLSELKLPGGLSELRIHQNILEYRSIRRDVLRPRSKYEKKMIIKIFGDTKDCLYEIDSNTLT